MTCGRAADAHAAARSAAGRDANGDPTTNENFPDMKGLVDHIHSLGLKAGIYSSPGPTTCQGLGATYQHEEQDARAYARWGFDYLKYDWCSYSRIAPNPTIEDRKKPYRLMGDILQAAGPRHGLQHLPVRRGQRLGVGQAKSAAISGA